LIAIAAKPTNAVYSLESLGNVDFREMTLLPDNNSRAVWRIDRRQPAGDCRFETRTPV
jgi:hypothetical protein